MKLLEVEFGCCMWVSKLQQIMAKSITLQWGCNVTHHACAVLAVISLHVVAQELADRVMEPKLNKTMRVLWDIVAVPEDLIPVIVAKSKQVNA